MGLQGPGRADSPPCQPRTTSLATSTTSPATPHLSAPHTQPPVNSSIRLSLVWNLSHFFAPFCCRIPSRLASPATPRLSPFPVTSRIAAHPSGEPIHPLFPLRSVYTSPFSPILFASTGQTRVVLCLTDPNPPHPFDIDTLHFIPSCLFYSAFELQHSRD